MSQNCGGLRQNQIYPGNDGRRVCLQADKSRIVLHGLGKICGGGVFSTDLAEKS